MFDDINIIAILKIKKSLTQSINGTKKENQVSKKVAKTKKKI